MNLNLFEFNEDDLRSNRGGMMSARQREWVEGMADGMRDAGKGGIWIALFFMVLGICMIFGLMILSAGFEGFLQQAPNYWPVLCVFPIVFGIMGLSRFWAAQRANRLREAPLLSVKGVAKIEKKRHRYGDYYEVDIAGERFGFGESVGDIFKQGEIYRVYFCNAEYYKLVLGVEKASA